MLSDRERFSLVCRRAVVSVSILATAAAGACSSSKSNGGPDSGAGSSSGSSSGSGSGSMAGLCTSYTQGGCGLTTDAGIDAAVSSCAMPGAPAPGPVDDHCATAADDGGPRTQTIGDVSECCSGADAGAGDGGDQGCPYGATMFGMEGDDDDCKYHVTWTSTPICEGNPGAQFVMKAVYRSRSDSAGNPLPLTGANPMTETFTTTTGDWDAASYCDDGSNHPGPTSGNHMTEGPPGTYTANVAFDEPGLWTLRFHFNEECADIAPDSPHGHAAFHFNVP